MIPLEAQKKFDTTPSVVGDVRTTSITVKTGENVEVADNTLKLLSRGTDGKFVEFKELDNSQGGSRPSVILDTSVDATSSDKTARVYTKGTVFSNKIKFEGALTLDSVLDGNTKKISVRDYLHMVGFNLIESGTYEV